MSIYRVGTGMFDITDPAIGLGMMGFSKEEQRTKGIESPLYARAFIIEDQQRQKRVVFVCADLWSCTQAIKQAVVEHLKNFANGVYTNENLLISGTHTHSGPGGYSHYYLYNYSMVDNLDHRISGFDVHNFECIVYGIVRSIVRAHNNLAPGKIYINTGVLTDCGRQRSHTAYYSNPVDEVAQYTSDTDQEMLLLKFVRLEGVTERPIGMLNWYAIHATDRGQNNTFVCGDNKGYASLLFEASMGANPTKEETFVAAFANANGGDISGNVEYGTWADGSHDQEHMWRHGKLQFTKAQELFAVATAELAGSIDFRHQYIDMPQATGAPGALGLSMFAGSTEDGNAESFLREGITEPVNPPEQAERKLLTEAFCLLTGIGVPVVKPEHIMAHWPKPITLATGLMLPDPITPNIVPIQIFKIGNLVITGVPAEMTTMAGRRLRNTVLGQVRRIGVDHVALATYANGYTGYITTREEYNVQHYEGASTLFGPGTLEAYQRVYSAMAQALAEGKLVAQGAVPVLTGVRYLPRVTIRNRSGSDVQLDFFKHDDPIMLVPLAGSPQMVAPNQDIAQVFPLDVPRVKVRLSGGNYTRTVGPILPGQLVTLESNGTVTIASYRTRYGTLNLQQFSSLRQFLQWYKFAPADGIRHLVPTGLKGSMRHLLSSEYQ